MSDQQVNSDQMRQAIAQLQEVQQQLQSAMDLAEGAAATVKAHWESSTAAPDFYGIIAQWQAHGPTLIDDTQKIITFLTEAADAYDAAEKKLTSQ